MSLIFGSLGVVAITELVKRIQSKDWQGVFIIIIAGLIGIGAGYFGIAGLTIITGLTAGLSAVGIHEVATKVGGK
jgi:hypothetical protein